MSFRLATADSVRESRAWFFALGVVFVVLGLFGIFLPYIASLATTITLGWLLIVSGLFEGFHAIQNRRWAGSAWEIVSALIHLLAGVLLVAFPVTGTITLTLVLAAFFVVNGVLKIIRAVQHRAITPWGWLLFDGLLSLALGVMIWAGWPSTAAWALGLLVGIDLVVGGTSMLLIGLGAGPVAAPIRH